MRAISLLILMLAFIAKADAQKNPIEKVWFDGDKTSKVQIYLAKDGKFYGKVIWLKEPIDKDTGKPQLDVENPDPKQRNTPVNGLLILKGFSPDANDKNVYTGGTVYDPNSGKTYCGKMTLKGNKLDMRGYICSFSLFGRTETWTEAEPTPTGN